MASKFSVGENYLKVLERIERAAQKSGRRPEEIKLVCVTKEATIEQVKEVISAGARDLGENRAQELLKKQALIDNPELSWHFIGVLQRNKVKQVLGKVVLIQSLDRLSLAEEIEKRASRINLVQKVLVEVNISGEGTKHGISPEELTAFLDKLENFPHLEICGLMTIAPYISPSETRPFFRKMRELFDKERENRRNLAILSMGMSNDFEIAIEEGSNMVRVGSAIFKGV